MRIFKEFRNGAVWQNYNFKFKFILNFYFFRSEEILGPVFEEIFSNYIGKEFKGNFKCYVPHRQILEMHFVGIIFRSKFDEANLKGEDKKNKNKKCKAKVTCPMT